MEMIYLAGMMGAGKSTVGRALAQRLGLRFVDLDQIIEDKASMSIAEIFGKEGEDYFREIESQALKEIAESDSAVVALGGGTLTRPENLRLVKVTGRSIYLRAPINTLMENLHDYSDRPLLAGESNAASLKVKLEELLARRRDSYETCDFIVDINIRTSADDIAADIAGVLAKNKLS